MRSRSDEALSSASYKPSGLACISVEKPLLIIKQLGINESLDILDHVVRLHREICLRSFGRISRHIS